MRLLVLASLFALTGCEKAAPPPAPLTSLAGARAQPAVSVPAPSPVAGWTTDGGNFLLLGRQAPTFKGKLMTGDPFSLEELRGRWTIVGFRASASADKTEDTFVTALNSAVDQDPDLDFLQVVVAPGVPAPNPDGSRSGVESKAPTLADGDHQIASAFGISDLPAYLLIGPDLTIEGVRGRLADSPDNGIKDVIRGVAQIRKQIADPT
jgi:hypothetical protein